MRSGPLDRKITIQRGTTTESDSGEPTFSWMNLVLRRSASYRPLRGEERRTGDQIVAGEQIEFVVRYSSDIADISPRDRVIYPALQDSSQSVEVKEGRVYDIIEATELGRREGFRIITIRRADILS